jgi:hypothetical protein
MADVDRKQAAIIGGLIVGVLSVTPIISAANFCCCLWAIVGGLVAAKLLINRSPQPVTAGEGAMIGLMAGLGGGGIYFFIGLPLSAATSGLTLRIFEGLLRGIDNPQVQEAMQQVIERLQNQSFAQRLLGSIPIFILSAIILAGFTVLGGLLGVALFEKRRGQAPPPPPQYPPPYPPDYPPPPSSPPPPPYGGGPASP